MIDLFHDNSYDLGEYLHSHLKDVGVAEFNREHRQLVELLLELHQLVELIFKGRPRVVDWQRIDDLLLRLADYSRGHFQEEERMMREYGYPEFAEHFREHQEFFNEFAELRERLRGGEVTYLVDLKRYLLNWFFTHINGSDFKYGEFFRSRGVVG